MNLILLADDDFIAADRVRLDGRRLAYVRAVHHAVPGTVLRVGRVNGRVGSGTVIALGDGELVLDVALDREPPPPAAVTLLLALPRPKVLRRMLQCAAAAGVKRIVVFNTWRVEKSFWSSPALRDSSVREQLLLGLEQGGDTVVPTVEMHPRFKPFVEDQVPALIAGTRALAGHPAAERPCPHALREPVTMAVGPEGGFTPYELELLCTHGFEAVSLGPRPLRVEHAVPALLGRLWSAGACSRFGAGGEEG